VAGILGRLQFVERAAAVVHGTRCAQANPTRQTSIARDSFLMRGRFDKRLHQRIKDDKRYRYLTARKMFE